MILINYEFNSVAISNRWNRAICVSEEAPQNFNVLFIDFGWSDTIYEKFIRPCPAEYVKFPSVVVKCKVEGEHLS